MIRQLVLFSAIAVLAYAGPIARSKECGRCPTFYITRGGPVVIPGSKDIDWNALYKALCAQKSKCPTCVEPAFSYPSPCPCVITTSPPCETIPPCTEVTTENPCPEPTTLPPCVETTTLPPCETEPPSCETESPCEVCPPSCEESLPCQECGCVGCGDGETKFVPKTADMIAYFESLCSKNPVEPPCLPEFPQEPCPEEVVHPCKTWDLPPSGLFAKPCDELPPPCPCGEPIETVEPIYDPVDWEGHFSENIPEYNPDDCTEGAAKPADPAEASESS